MIERSNSSELTNKAIMKECRPTKVKTFATFLKNVEDGLLVDPAEHSTYLKPIKIMARVMAATRRFADLAHVSVSYDRNACKNVRKGELYFWRMAQMHSFPAEFLALETGQQIDKNSRLINFSPFYKHDEGILRCGGRLEYMDADYNFKHPIIGPPEEAISRRFIEHVHAKKGHLGLDTVRYDVRKCFLILRGVQVIRGVLKSCLVCKRFRAASREQKMSDLPPCRVQEAQVWENVMIDFAGPVFIFVHGIKVKGYIALFSCLGMRALHCCLVESLELHEFIRCFDVFANIRNLPKAVYSDNAQTFKASSNFLIELFRHWDLQQLESAMIGRGVEWHFNCDVSPHRYAAVERSVGLLKPILIKTIGKQSLQRSEFESVLQSATRSVNSRPYTTILCNVDLGDPLPITPQHFISGDLDLRALPNITLPEIKGKSPKSLNPFHQRQTV